MQTFTLVASATVTKLFSHVVGLIGGVLHRHDHVGQLAHAGGLDEDAVRVELSLHVLQRLVEVPHQEQQMHPADISLICTPDSSESRRQC